MDATSERHTKGQPVRIFKVTLDYHLTHYIFIIIIKWECSGKKAVEDDTKGPDIDLCREDDQR